MDFNNVINNIPKLLMLFIPGYLALEIRRNYRQENKYNDIDIILLSITYSFIISRLAFFIDYLVQAHFKVSLYIPYISTTNEITEWGVLYYLIVSIIFGYIITVYPDTRLANYLKSFFRSNSEPYSNVWNYAMKKPNGAWVRVYLEQENIFYLGMIAKYTCNPDETRKEILLTSYCSYYISDNKLIEDYSDNDDAYVYINATDVIRIEIIG